MKNAFLIAAAMVAVASFTLFGVDPSSAGGLEFAEFSTAMTIVPATMKADRLLGTSALQAPEMKDSSPEKIVQEMKDEIEKFLKGHAEFVKTNDERLEQLEKKGSVDPLVDEKLKKIEADLQTGEDISKKLVEMEQAQKAAKDKLDETEELVAKMEARLSRPGAASPEQAAADRKTFVNNWARAVCVAEARGLANLGEDQQKAINDVMAEYKALNVSTDTAGGYLAPIEYAREIIKAATEISPVRTLARVRTTANKSISVPKRTGQFAAQWVAEQGTRSETEGLAYGLEEIHAHEFYALIDISNQNVEDNAFDMEEEIRMESSEQFAVAEGAAFVSGDGVGKPQGFLANANVQTNNSGAATAVTADALITMKHAIKTAYTRNANFVMNRTTLGSVRKLKDGQGQYLWMPGLAQGKPNSIDGDPYVEMPDMPNEGAGLKPVAYGDFRRAYTWLDRIAMEMLRDPYTQATAGNIRFIVRKRVGGQVTLAEAIRVMVCAA